MKKLFNGLLHLHAKDISRLQRIFDPIVLTGLFVLLQPRLIWSTPFASIPSWFLVTLTTLIVLPRSGIYSSYRHRSLLKLFRKISSVWFILLGILLLATYFNKSTASFSRIATTTWAISGWLWLNASHVLLRKIFRFYRGQGFNSRSVVYWGIPRAAESFAQQIINNPWIGFKVISWFSPLPVSKKFHIEAFPPCGGGKKEFKEWLKMNKVDRVVFSHISTDEQSINQMISLFGDISTSVVYAPNWYHPTMRFMLDSIGDQPCIDLWGGHQSLLDVQLKRTIDLLFTTIGVVFIAPILIGIALAVKFSSPGPIFYKQDRYGLDGKPFKCYKFRTMYTHEESNVEVMKQATADDPRVTDIGAFLRRWSLDELPQVFNVLVGEMSLVGPRPHSVQHNELYRKIIPGYMQRHAFKPGITGLAQISGWRGETKQLSDMENRIYADLAYQRDWSLMLDLKILIKTFLRLRTGNAY